MKTFRYLFLPVIVVALSACTTTSDGSRQQALSITARSGVKTLVAKNWHIDDNCSQIDYPAMTIGRSPSMAAWRLSTRRSIRNWWASSQHARQPR